MPIKSKSSMGRLDKVAAMKKISKSTKAIIATPFLASLKKRGAKELSIVELRKRLSNLRTPLSQEIIAERRGNY